jgi:hypothetical protein
MLVGHLNLNPPDMKAAINAAFRHLWGLLEIIEFGLIFSFLGS